MRLIVAGVLLAAVAAGGGYAVGAAADDDDPPAIKRIVVGGSTDDDATVDKWVTAECPEGSTVISGGAQIPHAEETPGVALCWSAPYSDHGDTGWWAAAQDTKRGTTRWVLQVQAICARGVETELGSGSALPPETFAP